MKFSLIYLICALPLMLFGQKWNRTIHQAERKIEKGKYEQALVLLRKAEINDYGFCGNTYFDINQRITSNEIIIFDKTNEPLKAANALNNLDFYFGQNLDSLKLTYFIKACGKNKVKKEFDACLNKLEVVKEEDYLFGLELPVSFSEKPFVISYETMRVLKRYIYTTTPENINKEMIERFRSAIWQSSLYQLLM